MKPVFRNPDKLQQLPYRDYLRENFPSGADGYVVEDLDVVLRTYGTRFRSDDTGRVMLIELKYHPHWIGPAQQRTFGLIHQLMRKGDPDRERYLGYYVVWHDNSDWEASNFWINRKPVDRQIFHRFLSFEDVGIPGLWEGIRP